MLIQAFEAPFFCFGLVSKCGKNSFMRSKAESLLKK